MDYMIMLAQLLLSLSILVAVHEMGHLVAAKYFGMRVEQFSIGFPPKIWSFTKGGTEYAISAIPLGGYVKISGMIDESMDTEAMKQDPQPWEFRSKPAWQRLIVMLGGVFVNVVLGIIIFIGLTFVYGDAHLLKDEINKNGGFEVGSIGQTLGLKSGDKIIKVNGHDYQYLEELIKPDVLLGTNASYTVDRDGQIVEIPIPGDFIQKFSKKESPRDFLAYRIIPRIESIRKGSSAEKMGLQKGDVITEVNGVPTQYYDQVSPLIKGTQTDSIAFKISRGGQVLSVKEKLAEDKTVGFYVTNNQREFLDKAEHYIKYGFIESIPLGTNRAFVTLFTQIKAFGKVISGALSPRESISGPIGIMQAFGAVWDWERFWSLTGVLSLVLAFMNLLPIPALDGGHVMFLGYEIISRRKPSDKFLENAQKIGMVFLLILMVLIFANDIIKLVERVLS